MQLFHGNTSTNKLSALNYSFKIHFESIGFIYLIFPM